MVVKIYLMNSKKELFSLKAYETDSINLSDIYKQIDGMVNSLDVIPHRETSAGYSVYCDTNGSLVISSPYYYPYGSDRAYLKVEVFIE